jgi:hypothetical protein
MDRLELLANEIAMLSNTSLEQLAYILVQHYDVRADVFEAKLHNAQFDRSVNHAALLQTF